MSLRLLYHISGKQAKENYDIVVIEVRLNSMLGMTAAYHNMITYAENRISNRMEEDA